MIKTLECPHCGQLNQVDTQKFARAVCGACKGKFSSLTALGAYKSDREIASALETESEFSDKEQVDINAWTAKLGGAAKQEAYVKEGFLKKIKKHASKIPFAKEAVAMYFCATDVKTPITAKLIAMGALAYIVLPLDAIPDIIVGLGYTDDAAAFWAAYKSISTHITDEHRDKAAEWFAK